jgi:hypothetical protein
VALVRTDVSEEPGASFIRVTKIGELGTTQAATSNRLMLRRNTYLRIDVFIVVTTNNAVFWDIKTQFVLHRRHIRNRNRYFFAAYVGC